MYEQIGCCTQAGVCDLEMLLVVVSGKDAAPESAAAGGPYLAAHDCLHLKVLRIALSCASHLALGGH